MPRECHEFIVLERPSDMASVLRAANGLSQAMTNRINHELHETDGVARFHEFAFAIESGNELHCRMTLMEPGTMFVEADSGELVCTN